MAADVPVHTPWRAHQDLVMNDFAFCLIAVFTDEGVASRRGATVTSRGYDTRRGSGDPQSDPEVTRLKQIGVVPLSRSCADLARWRMATVTRSVP